MEKRSMIDHDLNTDVVAAMAQIDLAVLGHEPESPIGQFSFHGCVGGVAAFRGKPPWEHHTSGDELLFVLSGESELTILEEGFPAVTTTLRSGRLVIIPRGLALERRSERRYVPLPDPARRKRALLGRSQNRTDWLIAFFVRIRPSRTLTRR